MNMSRQDFELIARVIRRATECVTSERDLAPVRSLANSFANELAATNPRFDRPRFLKACNVA